MEVTEVGCKAWGRRREGKKGWICHYIGTYIRHVYSCKVHPRTGHKGLGGSLDVELYSFFNISTRWGWVVSAVPWLLYSWERPGTHCIGGWVGPRAGLDGPQGWSGWVQKILLLPGFNPWTVQPGESIYWLSYPGVFSCGMVKWQNCSWRLFWAYFQEEN